MQWDLSFTNVRIDFLAGDILPGYDRYSCVIYSFRKINVFASQSRGVAVVCGGSEPAGPAAEHDVGLGSHLRRHHLRLHPCGHPSACQERVSGMGQAPGSTTPLSYIDSNAQ